MAKGRKCEFTQEKADLICEAIAEGESLRSIVKRRGMPKKTAIFKWLSRYPDFAAQYAHAREESTNVLFDEILDICDNATNDWMEAHAKGDERTIWKLNGEHVQRSRLRVDTRKWALSKLQPKKYGDRVLTEHTGNVQFSSMSDDELDQRITDIERQIDALIED